MAEVREVEVGYKLGGQIQVKKFDIQSTYEYSVSKRLALAPGEDPDEVIEETLDELREKILEPKGQAEFEALWEQRLKNEKKA